jgi:predicted dehydrogenase
MKQYPGATVTDSVARLLEKVEAVIVATPASSHAELGNMAIEAGVPALIEKPFALTVADAEQLAEKAEKRNVPILVGHLLEYHPVVERLKEMLGKSELGDLYYLILNASTSDRSARTKMRCGASALTTSPSPCICWARCR